MDAAAPPQQPMAGDAPAQPHLPDQVAADVMALTAHIEAASRRGAEAVIAQLASERRLLLERLERLERDEAAASSNNNNNNSAAAPRRAPPPPPQRR